MPISASNFRSNSLSGTVSVVDGYANISLDTVPYALEGNKSFVIKLRTGSVTGEVLTVSPTITLQDTSSVVSLTANVSSVAEGNAILYTLTTSNVVNGANVFFSTNSVVTANVNSNDFIGGNTGTITINNNVGTATLIANADLSLFDETGERFTLQIRTNNTAGNIVVTSSNVLILDTSNQYNVLSFVENSSTVAEGGTLTLTANIINIPAGTTLYYTTSGNATSATFTGGNTGSIVMNSISNTITLLPTGVPYSTTQNFAVQLRKDSLTGTVLATSNTIIAVDSALAYMTATGGNVSDIGGYRIHTFTSSNIFNVSYLGALGSIDVLSIGGGGSGGGNPDNVEGGSGGGAGGYVYVPAVTGITGNITVTIGAGGTSSTDREGANNGSNTSVTGPNFSNIISVGGGSGGNPYGPRQVGKSGGSGGGGSDSAAGGQGYGYPSPTQQGYPGGLVSTGFSGRYAGGGGAGEIGGTVPGSFPSPSGSGGNGLQSSISGTPTYYAGGGGGGATPAYWPAGQGSNGAPGGLGGGGAGAGAGTVNGTTNTGGGGGGAKGFSQPAGSGGSGIVIIRYPYTPPTTVSNVLTTANVFLVGSNITFTVNAQNANLLTLYYSTDGNVTASNFIDGNTGSFVANASGGIVTLQANTNIPLDESRSFRLQIRQDSTSGFISGSSANVIVSAYSANTSASGGNQVIDANGYRHHIFLSSNTLTINSLAQTPIEVFSVAGGGGSATALTGPGSPTFHGTGGGGAGGLLISNISLSLSPVSVVVGAGGQSAVINSAGYPGSNTTFGSYLTMVGGGGGGRDSSGKNGGSGGGGGGYNAYSAGSGYSFPSPTQQGYPGGAGGPASPSGDGGGGGGAGGAGAGGGSIGTGGIGVALSWAIPTNYGTSGPAPGRWFAGGGGGGENGNGGGGAPGGAGGGGDAGTSAIVNTGGGGGGHGNDGYNTSVGLGGSGIVIIRYPYS